MEDEPLALAAARGDRNALGALVERYRRYVYTIAYRISLHPDDAFDITQAVFLRLTERIDRYDARGPFRAWLSTMASRVALDHLRARPGREVPVESLEESFFDPEEDTRDSLDRTDSTALIEEAMQQLSPQQRAILTLQIHEDLGPKAVAERLGMTPVQVRTQRHRAIEKIRKILQVSGIR